MFSAKQLFSIVALSALLTVASAQARAGCTRNGTVQNGDTCNILSARDSVSTFQLANANNGVIDPLCDNLFPGEVLFRLYPRIYLWCVLCLGLQNKDCTTVTVVQTDNGCNAIAGAAGIPVTTLLANNPNVNSGCTNLYPGEVLCTASQIFNYTN
ncbi:hypothetical protein BJV78DRAFT_1150029 [Lactifluus subvellereus]|nr:hypothetical protein BJV78DRAFT_1150029 [Lactifluus subvellereus]